MPRVLKPFSCVNRVTPSQDLKPYPKHDETRGMGFRSWNAPILMICLSLLGNTPSAKAAPNAPQKPSRCLNSVAQILWPEEVRFAKPLSVASIQAAIADSLKSGLKPKVVVTKAGKFLFYPTLAPFRLAQVISDMTLNYGLTKGLHLTPFEYVRRDGVTIVGVVLLAGALGATPIQAAEYFLLPNNKNGKFEADTATPPRTDGILVYVDAIPDNNELAGYGESDFKARFQNRKGAHYIHPYGPTDMMFQLQKLSTQTNQPIAELEILGHGLPGEISITGASLSGEMKEISPGSINFAKNATIRLQSCLLSANFRGPLGHPGDSFLRTLGQKLLTQGGSVIASNHVIYVVDHFPKSAQKYTKPWAEKTQELLFEPLEAALRVTLEAIKSNDGPYRRINIPASTNLRNEPGR